jgi:hypothetical protein
LLDTFKQNEERAAFLQDLQTWYTETKEKFNSNPSVRKIKKVSAKIMHRIIPQEPQNEGMFALDEDSKPLPKNVVEAHEIVPLVRFCGEMGLLQTELHIAFRLYTFIIDEYEVPEILAKSKEATKVAETKDSDDDGIDSDSDSDDEMADPKKKKENEKNGGEKDNSGVVIKKKSKLTKDGIKGFERMCHKTYPACAYSFTHLIFKPRGRDVELPSANSQKKVPKHRRTVLQPPPGANKKIGFEMTFFTFLERTHYFCNLPFVEMYLHIYAMVWREIGAGKGPNTAAVAALPDSTAVGGGKKNDATSKVCDPRHVNAQASKKVVTSIFLHCFNNVLPAQIQLILDMLPWSDDDAIEVSTLVRFCVLFPSLMYPTVLLQRASQKQLFGMKFWRDRNQKNPMASQRKGLTAHLDPNALVPPKNEKMAWLITCSNLLVDLHHQSKDPSIITSSEPLCTRMWLSQNVSKAVTSIRKSQGGGAAVAAVGKCQRDVNMLYSLNHDLSAIAEGGGELGKIFTRNSTEFNSLIAFCRNRYGYKMTQFFVSMTLDAWEEGISTIALPMECLALRKTPKGIHLDRASVGQHKPPTACTCSSCKQREVIGNSKVEKAYWNVGGHRINGQSEKYSVVAGKRGEGWTAHKDEYFRHDFYYNTETGERTWDPPAALGGEAERFIWDPLQVGVLADGPRLLADVATVEN